jgi:F-type H+-transporting ATPase subunit epsilon
MMAVAETFFLLIVSPDQTLYEGKVEKILVPGLTQELAILPHHTPLYAQLVKGDINIESGSRGSKTIAIEGGIIRVKQDQVSILVGFDTRENIFKA